MRRAGQVVRVVNGMVLVRSDDSVPPSLGEPVVDEALETVGTIVDLIGPVERPFLLVSPVVAKDVRGLLNAKLYTK